MNARLPAPRPLSPRTRRQGMRYGHCRLDGWGLFDDPQVLVKERDDTLPGASRRRFVVLRSTAPTEHLEQRRHLGWVVIIQEGVPRVGVDLDVMNDAIGAQRLLQPRRCLAQRSVL